VLLIEARAQALHTAVFLGKEGADDANLEPMQQLFRLNIGEGTISPTGGDQFVLGHNEDGLLIHTCGSESYNRTPPPAVLVPKGSSRAFIFRALL